MATRQSEFDNKVVSVNALDKFAKNFNKKIKEKLDEINSQPVEKYDDTELRNMISSKADKSELFSEDYNDLSNKPEIPSIEGLASESYVNEKLEIDKAEIDSMLLDIFGIVVEEDNE